MTKPIGNEPDPALDLVNAAMVAKLAGALGAPRLAVKAARRAGELADAYVIGLSPALARTSPEAEALVLDDMRAEAAARRAAPVDDERGGAT